MGCVSSKIITKSASFRDDWSRSSFRRRGDETTVSKKGGSQFVALLCTANTVAGSLVEEGSHEHTSSYSTDTKDVDTKGRDERSSTVDAVTPKQSQVEDINCELDEVVEPENKSSTAESHEKGSRRKAMARDLAALKVPSFEFSRAGSLKDWLVLEVPSSSSGSYVTPKFGSFAAHAQDGDNVAAFDPELVWQLEQAMENFAVEEDCILEKIVEGREPGLLV
ncbi:uncharacterized protein M6B38_190620 [Iris pallida]|uniref:Uncharacterized protein n=1 Tax=Iris pallida TaxID=29817 RepID=A0AAX6EG21_IRIPA|nr:uncharacterized protein M6B38_190620 [Iris pallida]